jgi:hypothetical protein
MFMPVFRGISLQTVHHEVADFFALEMRPDEHAVNLISDQGSCRNNFAPAFRNYNCSRFFSPGD